MSAKSFEQVVGELRGKSILVANRGIPARRICRTISEMDAVPVMTATDVDKTSPATASARELLLLGKNPRAYLELERIVRKAKAMGAVAVHPGWGFGAEDDTFPAICEEAGLRFIGPKVEPMRLLGNKVAVRKLAEENGVPVVPGSPDAVDVPEAREIAKQIGFPIMLKAEGGGGGRGIYEVYSEEQLENAFEKASAMAQASFGNPRVYVEKLLTSVRHIEIQVIADMHGNVFAFDERDCTVQRNHQKLIEITPSPWPGMTEKLREELKEYSRRLVSAVGYYPLATVEFLVDTRDGTPYLIEVNTRLQVEHGITECRYGIDLVEEQIAIAFGSELRFKEGITKPSQWAMQVRINCEDPQKDFSPNSGRITRYVTPGGPGVRIDSCVSDGYTFPAQYDSAASLLIIYGPDWEKVVRNMRRSLREYLIGGVKTTIPFHRQVFDNQRFFDSEYDTKFVESAPELMHYRDVDSEAVRLSRLMAEISAFGYNPHVQLGEYRGPSDKRLGAFLPADPPWVKTDFKPRFVRGMKRDEIIEGLLADREKGIVQVTDTTTRDITQSNSGNRFRLAEDKLVGPLLDKCGFFSLENGGGAHFHVAMMANMTYPFAEAKAWNRFAPNTLKQILIRSTNVLGYKPQPKNLMEKTGEMICEDYDVIRCFDFLNHVENMRPFAEVALNHDHVIFEPALSMSWAKGFDVEHYLGVTDNVLSLVADVAGTTKDKAQRLIILGLKDMAGVCPPRFMRELIGRLRTQYPELPLHYHRHYTDGLFVPSVGAAAEAGAHIVDTAIGSSVRWYGQGDVLATAAYMEGELGLSTHLDKEMIRATNFSLKQVMPYYDKYVAPYFQGIDYDVVEHGMPGGATSSSQEGAMKQGYIHLLPYMLKFLAGTRKIVRYHDVTPGSQITWNTAFLGVTGAFRRDGERGVEKLLAILEKVTTLPESQLSDQDKQDRLDIYRDCNDAFRNLLVGKFGRLPLGFPADWVYESAFGTRWEDAIAGRTEESPLESLQPLDLKAERAALDERLGREPSDEEFILYLNHPGDALKTIAFKERFGDANNVPLDVWFEGLEQDRELLFNDSNGMPHEMRIYSMPEADERGVVTVRYQLDSEYMTQQVQVAEPSGVESGGVEMADPENECQIGSPSNGELWVMHAKPGQAVTKGEELFNISIMKQEKAVTAPIDGVVLRVLKTADFQADKKMVPVVEGELLVELGDAPNMCDCGHLLLDKEGKFCASCGKKL